jgi:hypothetical protein
MPRDSAAHGHGPTRALRVDSCSYLSLPHEERGKHFSCPHLASHAREIHQDVRVVASPLFVECEQHASILLLQSCFLLLDLLSRH